MARMTVTSSNFSLRKVSDVVALVCLPTSLLLFLQLQSLHNALHTAPRREEVGIVGVERDYPVLWAQSPESVPELPLPLAHPLLPPLNLTGLSNENTLLYTPLPQSGSSAVRGLLAALKQDNGFKLISEPPRKKVVIHVENEELRKRIVQKISTVTEPTALIHSFANIDFKKYGGSMPIHVSVVREPVERAISLFYRVRAPYQLVERYRQFPSTGLPSMQFLRKSLEACLLDPNDMECRYVPGNVRLGHSVEFFCGHQPECTRYGSSDALAIAQRNVNSQYAVVGVLELWPTTLAVLERMVPKYFTNATLRYYEELHGHQAILNTNFYKPAVESWAREALAKNMTVERQFYDFLKTRLLKQYEALYKGG